MPARTARSSTSVSERKLTALEQYTARLEERVVQLEALVTNRPEPRTISDEQGMSEVKRYFEVHDGEVIYPSDVAAALNVAYEKACEWISGLESDGEVVKATTGEA